MAWTPIQIEVMDHIIKGNPDGSFLDIDQLVPLCSHKPDKPAMRSTIRFLMKYDMVTRSYEHRRGARRLVITPTLKAYQHRRK